MSYKMISFFRREGEALKTYNVKEVANMLNTSEETVRRWIRSGKLKANMASRKKGSVITETMLKEFIKDTPKYAAILATPVGGIAAVSTILLGTIIDRTIDKNEDIKKTSINSDEIEKILQMDLVKSKNNIKNKRNTIAQLEKEVLEEETKIKSIQYLLKNIEKEKNRRG